MPTSNRVNPFIINIISVFRQSNISPEKATTRYIHIYLIATNLNLNNLIYTNY